LIRAKLAELKPCRDYYLTLMRQNLKNLESAFAGQSTVILPIQAQISTIAFIAHPIELGF